MTLHASCERFTQLVALPIVLSVAIAALAACTPTPTPVVTAPPPPPTSTTIASPVPPPTTTLTEVEVEMNAGGSLLRNVDHTVDVTLWESSVGTSTTVTFTVSMPCASSPSSPTLLVDGTAPTIEIPMKLQHGDRFAGANANFAPPTTDVLTALCAAGPGASLVLSARWGCGADEVVTPVGTLHCVPFDPTMLVDPTGGINIPLTTGGPCQPLAGRQVNIHRVKTESMAASAPVTFPDHTPPGGWVWSSSMPSVPHILAEPTLIDPAAATQFTDMGGIFAWNAAPARSYFLEVVGPADVAGQTCKWYSPVFTVTQDMPITDLHLKLLDQMPPSCTQNPNCP